jgi:hypothetical protein
LAAVLLAGQTPAIPDTPAGQKLAAWLAAFNQGSPEVTRKFAGENYVSSLLQKAPAERFAEMDVSFFRRMGPLEFLSAKKSSGLEIQASLRDREGHGWVDIRLVVESQPAYRIADINLGPGSRPGSAGPRPPMSEAELLKRLEAFLEKRAAADRLLRRCPGGSRRQADLCQSLRPGQQRPADPQPARYQVRPGIHE